MHLQHTVSTSLYQRISCEGRIKVTTLNLPKLIFVFIYVCCVCVGGAYDVQNLCHFKLQLYALVNVESRTPVLWESINHSNFTFTASALLYLKLMPPFLLCHCGLWWSLAVTVGLEHAAPLLPACRC